MAFNLHPAHFWLTYPGNNRRGEVVSSVNKIEFPDSGIRFTLLTNSGAVT